MVTPLLTPLGLDQAERIVSGALAEREAQGFMALTVAVLDLGGNLILLKRQDGSGILRADIAIAKAWAALGMGVPSGVMGKRLANNPGFLNGLIAASGGRFAPNPGGILILNRQGEGIGAIGISGDTGPNDEICAIAGARAAGLDCLPSGRD
ncbi:heme-binding protein [Paracoccus aurantiacus]|uniref:Heme-binding protein n=1 Tax=Paracoccus aurantiacus TaxID=2599412 RepID=A0A5C6S0D5_9RHOB|nr:heme-binding protein [Paracoccus aurantiacus]TXB67449.1 heme-binding protein [Paracoccus aurantiacus]